MESFVVRLYGMKNVNVNETWNKMFSRKFKDGEKTVNMNVSPLCESTLRFHSERANNNAAIWERVTVNRPEFPDTVFRGWDRDISITWVVLTFSEEIEMIRCTKDEVSIKDFFSKCDQIRRKLRIWSHLLKKSLLENFIFLCSDPF